MSVIDPNGIVINGQTYASQQHTYDGAEPGMFDSHLAEQRKYYEIARSTDFELIIGGLEGLTPMTGGDSWAVTPDEALRLSVLSTGIPHFSIEPITVRRGNSVTKYAGTPTFDANQEVQFYGFIGMQVIDILMSWQHQAYDIYTDLTGLMVDYKKDATLIEYSPDHRVIRSWTLYGLWVSGLSEDGFDKSQNQSERKVRATFQYDKAVPNKEDVTINLVQ